MITGLIRGKSVNDYKAKILILRDVLFMLH